MSSQILPNVDLNDIIKNYEEAKKGNPVDTGKVLKDMLLLGMIINMFDNQSDNEAVTGQVHSSTDRIAHLEAKVGDSKDVEFARNFSIRKLTLLPHGCKMPRIISRKAKLNALMLQLTALTKFVKYP